MSHQVGLTQERQSSFGFPAATDVTSKCIRRLLLILRFNNIRMPFPNMKNQRRLSEWLAAVVVVKSTMRTCQRNRHGILRGLRFALVHGEEWKEENGMDPCGNETSTRILLDHCSQSFNSTTGSIFTKIGEIGKTYKTLATNCISNQHSVKHKVAHESASLTAVVAHVSTSPQYPTEISHGRFYTIT